MRYTIILLSIFCCSMRMVFGQDVLEICDEYFIERFYERGVLTVQLPNPFYLELPSFRADGVGFLPGIYIASIS